MGGIAGQYHPVQVIVPGVLAGNGNAGTGIDMGKLRQAGGEPFLDLGHQCRFIHGLEFRQPGRVVIPYQRAPAFTGELFAGAVQG